jgi:hypothetical protein
MLPRMTWTTSAENSGAGYLVAGGGGRHCFVFASGKPCRKPMCTLVRGIVCHLPRDHLVAAAAPLRQGNLTLVNHPLFIDADLTAAAYESCAPPGRRLDEVFVLEGKAAKGRGGAAALSCPAVSRETELAELVQQLVTARGVGAIFMTSEACPAVAAVCSRSKVFFVTGMPARLIHALAEEAQAEVLHGLPTATVVEEDKQTPWFTEVALSCQLQDVSAEQRRSCFAFPLLGHRPPLLPHVPLPPLARRVLAAPLLQFSWRPAASPPCGTFMQSSATASLLSCVRGQMALEHAGCLAQGPGHMQ